MAMFNGYPASYQPVYYPQQYQQPQQQNNGIIWVQGEAGAKSYMVAPNTTVQLWDSERQTIYLKSADASGMPSIKTLDYTIREMPTKETKQGQTAYATKEDIETIYGQISALRQEIDSMTARRMPARKKEENNE